jgi:hypothetical protein
MAFKKKKSHYYFNSLSLFDEIKPNLHLLELLEGSFFLPANRNVMEWSMMYSSSIQPPSSSRAFKSAWRRSEREAVRLFSARRLWRSLRTVSRIFLTSYNQSQTKPKFDFDHQSIKQQNFVNHEKNSKLYELYELVETKENIHLSTWKCGEFKFNFELISSFNHEQQQQTKFKKMKK